MGCQVTSRNGLNLTDDQWNLVKNLSGDNINQLISQVILTCEKFGSFRDTFLAGLNFYHAVDGRAIDSVCAKLRADYAAHGYPSKCDTNVTTVGSRQFNPTGEDTDTSKTNGDVIKFFDGFRKETGTLFHALLEADLNGDTAARDKAFAKMMEYIKKQKAIYNADKAHYDNNCPPLYRGYRDVLNNDNPDVFYNSLNDVIDEFKKSVSGQTILMELPLWDDDATVKLKGRPDAITYDAEGHITIWDFKTTFQEFASNASMTEHYIQLSLYALILAKKLGIDPMEIKLQNITFQFKSGGVISLGTPTDINNKIPSKCRQQGQQYVRQLYPRKTATLSVSNGEKLLAKTRKMHDLVASDNLLRRFSLKSITAKLDNAVKEKKEVWLYSLKQKVTVERTGEGDSAIYKFKLADGTTYTREGKTEFTAKEFQEIEYQAVVDKAQASTDDLIRILRTKDYEATKTFGDMRNNKTLGGWRFLSKYCTPEWEYIECPELEAFNVIVMRKVGNGLFEFIVNSASAVDTDYLPHPDLSIITSLFKDLKELKSFKTTGWPEGSIANFLKLQAFMAIVNFKEVLGEGTVGNVCVFNSITGVHDEGFDAEKYGEMFHILQYVAEHNPSSLESPELFKTIGSDFDAINWQPKEDVVKQSVSNVLHVLAIMDPDIMSGSTAFDMTQENLISIAKELKERYPEVSTVNRDGIKSEILLIYDEVLRLTDALEHDIPNAIHEMHKRSITFQTSLVAGILLLKRGEVDRFTSTGLMLTGLALGLATSVSYASPDEIVRRFNLLYDAYGLLIVNEGSKELEEVNAAVKKMILANKSLVTDWAFGAHADIYDQLLQHASDGSVAASMMFKNPYNKVNTAAYPPEGLYCAEVLLWAINRHKMSNYLDADILKLSYSELRKNASAFKSYVDLVNSNDKFLQVPLKPKEGIKGHAVAFKNAILGKTTWTEFFSREGQRLKLFVDPVVLNEDLAKQRDELIEKMEFFNPYVQGDLKRVARTERNGQDYWNHNLNEIVCDYVYSAMKEKWFNQLLPTVDRQLATLRLMEVTTGRDLSAQIETLKDRVKISIYNKSLINPEDEDLIKAMGIGKTLTSLTKIAARPALYVKEMLLGRLRNTAAILTKQVVIDGEKQISFGNLLSAAKDVFGGEFLANDDKKFDSPLGDKSVGDFGFVNQLNGTYLINDRDLNAIGETMAYDRYGMSNWGTRMLYLNVIKPDWYNRMIIFVAKMHADGTYAAHSMVNGLLTYDISKDERVSYFWKYKNNPTAASDRAKFLKLKAFYNLMIEQFNKEGYSLSAGTGGKFDAFPRAYTSKQNDSIKELIGIIYGYYGHEERANMLKGLWWALQTQFLTFLPGSIRKYLATGQVDSSICQVVHLKDPATKKKLFYKEVAPGIVKKITTENDSGIDPETHEVLEPVLEHVNVPLEGLIHSTIKQVGRICRGNFSEMWEDTRARNNCRLLLFNSLFAALVAAIFAMLANAGIDAKSNAGVGIAFDTLQRAANELNVYLEILSPVGDFNLVGMDFAKDIFTNAFSMIGSEDYNLLNLANDTFAGLKDTHIVN